MPAHGSSDETYLGPDTTIDQSLGPVLVAALRDLTAWVYFSHVSHHLRWGVLTHHHLSEPDGPGRAGCVGVFHDLAYHGVTWTNDTVCAWATQRGWMDHDVACLRRFASDVQAGVRIRTGPRPIPSVFAESWLRGDTASPEDTSRTVIEVRSCCREFDGPTRSRRDARDARPSPQV